MTTGTQTTRGEDAALPPGFELLWYELRSVLGQGGFGITYLAQDTNLDMPVAIKEYLPNEFAARENDSTVQPKTGDQGDIYRWGLERFLEEARTLAQFKHPHIVRVLSVFEANNTAYMVMEYEEGEDLAKVFKRREMCDEQHLLGIFLPVLSGLKLVHEAGFIHRDIKPSNIYLRSKDHSPVLIDFGSARKSVSQQTRALTSLVSYGFAPYEQYQTSGEKQGPWTDIYSLGASLYLAVTGKLPTEALTRGTALLNHDADPYVSAAERAQGQYSAEFLGAIDQALRFRVTERPQNVSAWANLLQGKTLPQTLVPATTDTPEDETVLRPARHAPPTDKYVQQPTAQPVVGDDGETVVRTTRPTGRGAAAKPQKRWIVWLGPALAGVVALAVAVYMLIPREVVEPPPVVVQPDAQAVEIERLLARAGTAEREGRLIPPAENSAFEAYRRVLALDSGNALALQGVARVVARFVGQAERNIADADFVAFGRILQILEIIDTGGVEVARLTQLAEDKRREMEQAAAAARLEAQRIAEEQQRQREAEEQAEREAQAERERAAAEEAQKQAREAAAESERRQRTEAQRVEQERARKLQEAERRAVEQARLQAEKRKEIERQLALEREAKRKRAAELAARPPDIAAASALIGRFKRALENRDMAELGRVSLLNSQRRSFVTSLFANYSSLEVKISDFSYLANERAVFATMTITQLVTPGGDRVTPGAAWKQARLEIRALGGPDWEKIRW